jgi:WD40 repeat protein
VYDLEKQTSIVSMTKYDDKYTLDAVWMSAFTKKSKVAFYTSEPHTFIVEPISGSVKRIEGTSFLCYSPDGKYMALSNQGYIQYEDRWLYGTWGHQKSSTVYIYDTETLSRVKTLSCFFGEKITGVRERRGSVASVAFSQDNSQLLVSSDDGVVVIYNLEM